MHKLNILTILTITAVIGLTFANIALSATLSHQGIKLAELEAQASELKKQNQHISQTLSQYTALNQLKQLAVNRGFSLNVDYQVIPYHQPLAYNQ